MDAAADSARARRCRATHLGASLVALTLLPALGGCTSGSAPVTPLVPPNVVLITIDTLRADRVTPEGPLAALTPHLQGLAARGVRFTDAMAHSPLTFPSHVSIHTGLLPSQHGVRDNGSYVLEDSALTDTFPVRAGRILALPVVQEIPLTGVLRSELDSYLQERIGRILRNPTVDAEPLMRLVVLGGVQSPGYYNVPADLLLSDLVMVAGGPVGEVRLDKSKIKRFGEEIVDKESVRYALDAGMTLDRLNLAGGDEVAIGYDKLGRMERAARTVLLILSIPLAIAALGSL